MSTTIEKFIASDAIVSEIAFHENYPQIEFAGACAARSWDAVHTYHERGSDDKDSVLLGYVVYDDDRGRVVEFHVEEAEALATASAADADYDTYSVGEMRLTRELFEKKLAEFLHAAGEYTKADLDAALGMADTDDQTRAAIAAWALDSDREACHEMTDAIVYTVQTGTCAIGQEDIAAWREATA